MKRRALVSVSDKTGLIEFVKQLVELDFEIISTGGTKKALDTAGIKTISIDEVTGFPEMLDGRVKTLHPLIHGGLLAVRDNPEHRKQTEMHHIEMIDLVCVNLYPFKETIMKPDCTFELAIENIDIGGPSMIRSAAKNHRYVTVVTDQSDYQRIIDELRLNQDTTLKTRSELAAKAFRLTASYDALIQQYLTEKVAVENPEKVTFSYDLKQTLRYGENPHQSASFYVGHEKVCYSIAQAVQLHGKELSYNNIQDANAALQVLADFQTENTVVALKHMNPCGIACADTIDEAWEKAYEADPVSIFGGVIAFNRPVPKKAALLMSSMFLEIILAPAFDPEALEILSQKKNIRLMTFEAEGVKATQQMVSVNGGLLVQSIDECNETETDCKCVSNKQMSQAQIEDCLFGNKVVKHVKSNAIVVVKNKQTLGIGAGQMNRVGAAKIALEQAGEKAKGAVMASDAYFPMNDTVELAASFGIAAIIQPGGSIKDQDSIDMANTHDIAMVFSGKRHFKH